MMKYFIITVVLLSCSCKNSTVKASTVTPDDSKNSTASIQPQILIAKRPEVLPVKTTTDDNSTKTENKTELCKRMMCPKIFCPNSLPSIPSQGICCPRCIFNTSCNASTCPQIKCATPLIPANITAGECCDRCAPLPTATTAETKETKVTKKVTGTAIPKKSSSSSSSEEKKDERDDRSSEEYVQSHRYNLYRHESKPKKPCSRLIRLLAKNLIHLRRVQLNRRFFESSESLEY